MNQEMIKELYSVISPSNSNSNRYNELNPFRSKSVQPRNFLIIHLMLITTNSIKKSIQNHSFSLIITNTDDEFDDRSKKPKIKNEYSYRVIKLQERDYPSRTKFEKRRV